MGAAFLITLREGLEASLVIAVLAAYLGRMGQRRLWRELWLGGLAAAVASLMVATAVFFTVGELKGTAEEVFEGLAMALAAAILTYMIFWMRHQSTSLRRELEEKAAAALRTGSGLAIALLAFTAVFREGAETVLFMTGATKGGSQAAIAGGVGLGLAGAAALGYLVYRGSHWVNLRAFFNVTSLVLLIFAAGLVGRATLALQTVGVFPATISVWDTSGLLREDSGLGAVLWSLVGYTSSPSALQLIFYLSFLVVVGYLYLDRKADGQRETYGEPFRALGSDYTHRLYDTLRSVPLPAILSAVMGALFAALVAIAVLGVDVGPFNNEGPLRWGPFANPENENNLFNFLLWVVWLPLLSITAVALGRLWCGNLCPLRLIADLGSNLGDRVTGRPSLANPYLRAGWILPVSFIIVTFFSVWVGIQSRAIYGVYLFATFFLFAFLVGLLFRRGTWCRYVCPIGGWLARIARLSPLAIRPNWQVCSECTAKPCLTGETAGPCPTFLNPSRLNTNCHCLACWKCIRNCPVERSSLRLGWRLPGAELLRPTAPNLWEAIFIVGLLGMYAAVGHRSADLAQVSVPLLFFSFMSVGIGIYLAACWLAAALGALSFREAVTNFGYIFLPLEFAIAVITFGDDALEFFGVTQQAAVVLLTLGFVWSALLGASILRHHCSEPRRGLAAALPVAAILVLALFLWLNWYAAGTVVDLT